MVAVAVVLGGRRSCGHCRRNLTSATEGDLQAPSPCLCPRHDPSNQPPAALPAACCPACYRRHCRLSPELAGWMGRSTASRPEVTKHFWACE